MTSAWLALGFLAVWGSAFGAVLLVLAMATVFGLVVAITWRHFDLLRERNEALLDELLDVRRELVEAWAAAKDASGREADAWAAVAEANQQLAGAYEDVHALTAHHDAAATEGLLPPERWN